MLKERKYILPRNTALLFTGLCLFIFSCKKKENELPPVIIKVETDSMHGMQHGDGLHAMANALSYITVDVSDDKDLKQLRCAFITPVEEHSHAVHGGGDVPAFQTPNIGEWDAFKEIDIAGREHSEKFKFKIPENLSGAWNLSISALDADGNITHADHTVVIQNDSIPAILPSATSPAANADGIIELPVNTTFTMEGNILDGDYLEIVTASLYQGSELVWQQQWIPQNTWMFSLSQIQPPAISTAGTYSLMLEARDRGGWHNRATATIEVKP